MTFDGLAEGVYLLSQTGAADVIAVQNMLFVFPQETEGAKKYDLVLAGKTSFPGGAVILTKTDPDGKTLANAEFTLEVQEENTWKKLKTTLVSDKNGQIVVTDLPVGSYRFVETKAPEGYMLLADPVPFEITKAGQVELADGIYKKSSGDVQELNVINAEEFPSGPLYDKTPTPAVSVTPSAAPSDGGNSTPGNNPSGNNPSGNSTPGSGSSNVKTGDNSPILSLTIMLLLAAGVITMNILVRKRNGEK